MISLNRPYDIKSTCAGKPHPWEERGMEITYSSREGLSRIYRLLYEERGALRVAVSPLTCFIAIYPIVANGHTLVFVDIDPETLNMSEEALMAHEDVDAVQTIYLGGNPMRMDKVMNWAKKHGVVVIEDCAQALGASYKGQLCGTFGEFAVASAVKNLYAVCGGLLVSQKCPTIDPRLIEGSKTIRPVLMVYKHVKRWLEKRADARKGNIWNAAYWGLLKLKDTQENGFANCIHRVPTDVEKEIRAALGQIEAIQAERTRKAERLIAQIDSTKYRLQQVPEGGESTRNRVIVVALHREAREVIGALRAKGIAANNLTQSYTHSYQEHVRLNEVLGRFYPPLHTHTHTWRAELSNYEKIFPYVISIPCSPALTDKEIDYIANCLNTLN